MASKSTQTEPVETLVPEAEPRVIRIGPPEAELVFEQKPLSFFQKLEVFSVLGKALDRAMSGPDGLTLSELFDGPNSVGEELNTSNFQDANTFVRAISKLVQYAPELIADLYVIILGIPRGGGQRELAKIYMELPEDQGGLSDDDGFGILETFVDQNWEVMVDFFTVRITPLINKVNQKVQLSQQ